MKKEWLMHVTTELNADPQNRFDKLLKFLKSQVSIYEQLKQLRMKIP